MTVNSNTAANISQNLGTILLNTSQDDQNTDNIGILADVLFTISKVQMDEEVYL